MKVLSNGWAFPDADAFMAKEIAADGTYQFANLSTALRHVTDFSAAVDGGAHAGTWTKVLAKHFARVLAIEPSPDTFECLVRNMAQFGCTNVEPHNVALGKSAGTVTMALDAVGREMANTGARHAQSGGSITSLPLDSFDLPSLGFLKLDVEGSEVVALEGARETLARCKPVVLFENKKLWYRHYGLRKDAVTTLLTGYRYRFLADAGCDAVWGPA